MNTESLSRCFVSINVKPVWTWALMKEFNFVGFIMSQIKHMNAGVQGMEFIAVLFNGTHGLACHWVNYGYNAVGPVKGMPCGFRLIMIIRQNWCLFRLRNSLGQMKCRKKQRQRILQNENTMITCENVCVTVNWVIIAWDTDSPFTRCQKPLSQPRLAYHHTEPMNDIQQK